ncbi:hypothetical protein BJX63DRAFT_390423 [Aspergillus granulosus]|uniref:Uncharacterized protein n=1 Tax=Aspergillus granulosus TaxID=176169 RepID=A0ABR4HHY4_9EURO
MDDYIREMDNCNYEITGDRIIREQEWYQSETMRKAFLRPEASWRRMFVSDPPPRLGSMEIRLEGCGCYRRDLAGRLGRRYRHLNESPGVRLGLIWAAVVFILDDLLSGEFFLWWKRVICGSSEWALEIDVDTEHFWECYQDKSAYRPSGLQVVKNEDLIEYRGYSEREGSITEEAPPVSALRKHNGKKEDWREPAMTTGIDELNLEDCNRNRAKGHENGADDNSRMSGGQ